MPPEVAFLDPFQTGQAIALLLYQSPSLSAKDRLNDPERLSVKTPSSLGPPRWSRRVGSGEGTGARTPRPESLSPASSLAQAGTLALRDSGAGAGPRGRGERQALQAPSGGRPHLAAPSPFPRLSADGPAARGEAGRPLRAPLDDGICRRAAGAPSTVAPGEEKEFPGLGAPPSPSGRGAEASGRRRGGARARGRGRGGLGAAPS